MKLSWRKLCVTVVFCFWRFGAIFFKISNIFAGGGLPRPLAWMAPSAILDVCQRDCWGLRLRVPPFCVKSVGGGRPKPRGRSGLWHRICRCRLGASTILCVYTFSMPRTSTVQTRQHLDLHYCTFVFISCARKLSGHWGRTGTWVCSEWGHQEELRLR